MTERDAASPAPLDPEEMDSFDLRAEVRSLRERLKSAEAKNRIAGTHRFVDLDHHVANGDAK